MANRRTDEDAVFTALADATRRQMLDRLFENQGLTLSELVEGLGMRRQSATRHLQVLEDAGLVVVRWRGREKCHFLNALPIHHIQRRWIGKFAEAKTAALAELKRQVEKDSGGRQ